MRVLMLLLSATLMCAQPPSTNLVARYIAGTGITSNGGNPDLISQWNDQTANGYNLTQSTDARKPYNAVDSQSRPVVRFPYAYPTHPNRYVVGATLTLVTRSYTMCAIRSGYHAALEDIVSANGWSSLLGVYTPGSGAQSTVRHRMGGTGFNAINPPVNITLMCSVSGASSAIAYTIDDSESAAAIGSTTTTGIRVGVDQDTTGGGYSGDLYELLIYSTALDLTSINAIRSYAASTYGVPAAYTKQVVFIGDSNTEGNVLTGTENMVTDAHPQDWKAINAGLGGSTLYNTWLNQPIASSVDVMYKPGLARNVCVIMLGTNDINSNGRSAAQTMTALSEFVADRKAIGWEVWVLTILPLSGSPETVRAAYNALLVDPSSYSNAPEKIIDYRSDPYIGSSPMNAAYQAGDNLHVNLAGARLLASYIYAQLNGGTAGTFSGPVTRGGPITVK